MSCGEEREVLARWNNGQWPTCVAPLPQASHHAEFQARFTSSDQNTAYRTMNNASKYTTTISISIDNNSTHVRSQNLIYGLVRCFASEEWKLVTAIPVIPRRLKPICVSTTNVLYFVTKLNKYHSIPYLDIIFLQAQFTIILLSFLGRMLQHYTVPFLALREKPSTRGNIKAEEISPWNKNKT